MASTQRSTKTIVRNVLDGTEEIVCHHGTNQYGDGGITGVSACGLAALNFARVTFKKERETGQSEDLLEVIVDRETIHVRASHVLLP
jgi:hypothetical protein